MANIMSMKQLRNKPSRNGFDLSRKFNFTAKAGECLPYGAWHVLPGDVWTFDLKSFTRTQPVNTAAYARIREYYDFYFVPYDLLWNKAYTLLTQMYDYSQHATSIDPTVDFRLSGEMPYVTVSDIANYLNAVSGYSDDLKNNYLGYDRAKCSAKLLQYLRYGTYYGYANGDTWSTKRLQYDAEMNILSLLAYQKIYADHIRDSQWEDVPPSCFNVDYLGSGSMHLDISSDKFRQNYNLFDLRYCNYQKDLFHGLLPKAQYGDGTYVSSRIQVAPGDNYDYRFSILALRQAEFLQKWKEITLSGNKDYREQVEKHWNVNVQSGYSDLSTYLGGIASSLDINEVVNTNITGDYGADIAGKGTGVSNGVVKFESQGRYGVVMCIYHCLPLVDYVINGIDMHNLKVNALDFAIPEFDRIGMQSVPELALRNPEYKEGTGDSMKSLGYAPRYIEYKTDFDLSVGGFSDSLKPWIIPYSGYSATDYRKFKVNPNVLDNIFGVQADSDVSTDQFLCSTFCDIKVVRNLDTNGLPY